VSVNAGFSGAAVRSASAISMRPFLIHSRAFLQIWDRRWQADRPYGAYIKRSGRKTWVPACAGMTT
jgi:hypothetical protein